MSVDDLRKIDLLRERMRISYQEAAELLRLTEGSVVDALVLAEARQKKAESAWEARARGILEKTRALVREGNATKVKVIHKGRPVLVFPVTVGVAGAVLLPKVTLLAAALCLLGRCCIEVGRENPEPDGLVSEGE